MDFKAVQAVNHAAAGLLQDTGILDIALLIEAGAQLNKDNNLFSILCCFDQCINNLALVSQTVQCHLNRNNALIFCRLVEQADKRFDALKWIGKQNIFFHNLRNQRRFRIQLRCHTRGAALIEQLLRVGRSVLLQTAQISLQCKDK